MTLTWPTAFFLTLAIELPIGAYLLRVTEPSLARRLALLFFANLASHPLVWFFFPHIGLDFGAAILLAELWAWLSEATLLALVWPTMGWQRALLVALVANALSFIVGAAIQGQ